MLKGTVEGGKGRMEKRETDDGRPKVDSIRWRDRRDYWHFSSFSAGRVGYAVMFSLDKWPSDLATWRAEGISCGRGFCAKNGESFRFIVLSFHHNHATWNTITRTNILGARPGKWADDRHPEWTTVLVCASPIFNAVALLIIILRLLRLLSLTLLAVVRHLPKPGRHLPVTASAEDGSTLSPRANNAPILAGLDSLASHLSFSPFSPSEELDHWNVFRSGGWARPTTLKP